MNWGRIGRGVAWVVGGALLLSIVAVGSFCVSLRSERRSNLVVVPELIGRSRDQAAGEAAKLALGFEVAELRHDPGVAVDRIVQQEPPSGTQVRRGRTIRVVVSLGGETLTVPSLIGQPARQAEAAVRRQGLTPGWEARIHDDAPVSQVIAVAPVAGSLSVAGERVHRLVSDGPRTPRWVMPNLAGRTLQEAREWINLCGFRNGAAWRVPAEGRRSGTVVGQLPLSGYPIAARDVVELTVAE